MQTWDPFRDSFRIVERFGSRFRGLLADDEGEEGAHVPAADVFADREGVTFWVELPGVGAGEVSLTLGTGTLVVEAERVFAHRDERKVERLEGRYGHLRRTFVLPAAARPEQALAELHQGVLRIFVPCHAVTAAALVRRAPTGDEPASPVPIG